MKKIFVGRLPQSMTEDNLRIMFSEYGTVRSINLVKNLFTGVCSGFGFLEMEGHEARAAIAGLNGKQCEGNFLKVKFEDPRKTRHRGKRH